LEASKPRTARRFEVTASGKRVVMKPTGLGRRLEGVLQKPSVAHLFRWKVSNPLLIAATAVVGLIAFPLLQPTRVMVH
jgi:chromate transporter